MQVLHIMNNNNKRLAQLFDLYYTQLISEQEREEFLGYVIDPLYQEDIHELLANTFEMQEQVSGLPGGARDRMLNTILKQHHGTRYVAKRVTLWRRVAAAAAIIIITGAGLFFYKQQQSAKHAPQLAYRNNILPGGNKAVLILSGGARISLTNAPNGRLVNQSGFSITKEADGKIIYDGGHSKHSPLAADYNIIETPKGGQYQVTLPDGSNVWLNAASHLRYPVAFADHERKVELNGEAYFEVAKDKNRPFRVVSSASDGRSQEVEVLGTHFNVNSYKDESAAKTSLLEGSVKIASLNSNRSAILKPGEQAAIAVSGKIAVSKINVNKTMAWTNGKFVFDNENLESIMRKLARWYNVEVIYEGDVHGKAFAGTLSRYDDISKILDKISFTQAVHFTIVGKTVIVKP